MVTKSMDHKNIILSIKDPRQGLIVRYQHFKGHTFENERNAVNNDTEIIWTLLEKQGHPTCGLLPSG